jgi:hypothetical protein
MVRLTCGLILVLLVASPSLGQQALVGTYKRVSYVAEIDGTPTDPIGKTPRGYLIITPTRYTVVYTGDNRKFGTSAAEKVALFDTMASWSGAYRVEGGKIMIAVDVSWVENWNGKDQTRNWSRSGNRLTFANDPQPYGRDPSKTAIIKQVWEKVE